MINLNNYNTICSRITGDEIIDSLMEYINQEGVVFQSTYFELKTNHLKIYGAISVADPVFEFEFEFAGNPIMIEYKDFGAVIFRCNDKLYWMTKGAILL